MILLVLSHLDTVVLRMVHHCARQRVETDKVRQRPWPLRILHHIALNDVLLGYEPMQNIRRAEDGGQVELLQVVVEKAGDSLHVRGPELPDARGLGGVRQLVQLQMSLHGHVAGQVTELDFNQLLWIDGPVPIATGSHRLGEHHSSCVDCLENAIDVNTSCDLSDQHWCQPLSPQLLVDTEEVDLDYLLLLLIDPDVSGDCRDEAHQFVALAHPHSTMPLLEVARRLEGPGQELGAVVKPEHVVIILHVVLIEQHIELLKHQGIIQLQCVPLEPRWQGEGLLSDLLLGHVRGDVFIAGHHLINGGHGLGGPELVTLLGRLLLTLGRASGLHVQQLHGLLEVLLLVSRQGLSCSCCAILGCLFVLTLLILLGVGSSSG